ncbi:MAG: hypothetical protein PHU07_02625 [Acidocella sp.]|nr:hypothetical protein [Acidocella sp.]
MNFFDDVAGLCRTKLLEAGYSLPTASTTEEDVFNYLRVARRRIEPLPRTVHIATELVCPPEHQQGFDAILERAEAGEPLRPYQSKRVGRASYNDNLLNAWDIHHFHFGTTIDVDGWASRTGPLLYARVTPTDFYCIKVLEHGAWTQQDLVATLHRNWAASLEPFHAKGAIRLAYQVTDEQVKAHWDLGINTAVQVEENFIYMPMGGGFSSNKTSTWVVMGKIWLAKECRRIEEYIQKQLDDKNSAVSRALSVSQPPASQTNFHLNISDGCVCLVDLASGVTVNIGERLQLPALI